MDLEKVPARSPSADIPSLGSRGPKRRSPANAPLSVNFDRKLVHSIIHCMRHSRDLDYHMLACELLDHHLRLQTLKVSLHSWRHRSRIIYIQILRSTQV